MIFENNIRLSDLHIDESKYSKQVDPNNPNIIYFNNAAEGISITTFEDGRVRHIFYGPSFKDEHLRCRVATGPASPNQEPGAVKFDQYGFISLKEETRILYEVATTLKGWAGTRVHNCLPK